MPLHPGWIQTVERGITDPRWDAYDAVIQNEITTFNNRFISMPGYARVNWLLIKAMLWTESGGPDEPAWNGRVMQIGNHGDPGFGVLSSAAEGSDLIMSDALRTALRNPQNINRPDINIRAAITYLFTRMAEFETRSLMAPWSAGPPLTYKVQSKDYLVKIAQKAGTTLDELKLQNPHAGDKLREGMTLKYYPALMKQLISGWRPFHTTIVAERYNGGGDENYAAKLNFLLHNVFSRLQRFVGPPVAPRVLDHVPH